MLFLRQLEGRKTALDAADEHETRIVLLLLVLVASSTQKVRLEGKHYHRTITSSSSCFDVLSFFSLSLSLLKARLWVKSLVVFGEKVTQILLSISTQFDGYKRCFSCDRSRVRRRN